MPTNLISPSRYIGKICDKHPEKKGERMVKNYSCSACYSQKKSAKAKKHRDQCRADFAANHPEAANQSK